MDERLNMVVVCTHNLYIRLELLSLLLLCSPVKRITAQDRRALELPEFEVASVKPIDTNVPHMVGVEVYPEGRVVISGLSLKALTATRIGWPTLQHFEKSSGNVRRAARTRLF